VDQFSVKPVERATRTLEPAVEQITARYHRGLTQMECAGGIIFRTPAQLTPLYETLVHATMHTIMPGASPLGASTMPSPKNMHRAILT